MPCHARTAPALLLGLAVLASGGTTATAAQFTRNDLYLANLNLTGSPTTTRGIVRIVPSTWTSTPLITFAPGEVPQFFGRFAYDPFRDRLVLPDTTTSLTMVSAAGARTALPYTWSQTANLLAPTRGGRLYMTASTYGAAIPALAFIDSAGATHTVLGASGPTAYALNFLVEGIIYDSPSNSLIVATSLAPNMRLKKLVLSADGLRVTNDSLDVNVFVTSDDPHVMSLSRGPNGMIFVKIDDNSNASLARMLLINPATLTTSVWATSGYQGVGGETAGCYSEGGASPAAIVLDTLTDHLRGYIQGASGNGSLLPTTGVSSNTASGDRAQLLAIDAPSCPGDANGDSVVDFIDLNIVLSQFGMTGPSLSADFDHDGDVDFTDLNVVLSGFGVAC